MTVDDRLISQELGIVETSLCGVSTELTDFWISGIFSGFNRRQCVRDWSGILCERFGIWVRETGFGDGDEVTEPVEVPSPYLERARRKHSEQRYSGKPDGFAGTPRSAISYQQLAISG